MRGAYIFATSWFIAFFTVSTANNGEGVQTSGSDESLPMQEHHTFVALIDIVFVDNSKRTCTGAIIHDYVVITAAHCFVNKGAIPELTLSFIVMGTKRMFNSGYEQYLPIERYKIHPKFKGWTADLALVYTFAAMTSDKSGKVLHLSHDMLTDPRDTVTVLSWGQTADKFKYGPMKIYKHEAPEAKEIQSDSTEEDVTECNNKQKPEAPFYEEGIHATHMRVVTPKQKNIEKTSRYLNSADTYFRVHVNRTIKRKNPSFPNKFFNKTRSRDPVKKYYSNWRRKMGLQQNNLTVETFSFVNFQSCQNLVERGMTTNYEIKDERDFVCYTSEEYTVTSEDSGAPAIRRGRLLAVTAGGVDVGGERVAVGVRIACFCPWIAANVPALYAAGTEPLSRHEWVWARSHLGGATPLAAPRDGAIHRVKARAAEMGPSPLGYINPM